MYMHMSLRLCERGSSGGGCLCLHVCAHSRLDFWMPAVRVTGVFPAHAAAGDALFVLATGLNQTVEHADGDVLSVCGQQCRPVRAAEDMPSTHADPFCLCVAPNAPLATRQ